MALLRRIGSFLALAALLIGAPAALVRLGFYDWGRVSLWSTADVRVLLGVLTVVGWAAWAAFTASVVAEAARFATSGRLRPRLPGLRAPQALAALLLAGMLASGPASVNVAQALPAAGAGDASPGGVVGGRPGGEPAGTPASAESGATADADALSVGVEEPGGAAGMAAGEAPEASLVHVVDAGDDLWTLAERYYGSGQEWARIVRANPDVLAEPTAELPVGVPLAIADPVEHYVVRKGDMLRTIAARVLGDEARWPELRRLNSELISDPDHIEVGWVLRVPAGESARTGGSARSGGSTRTPKDARPAPAPAPTPTASTPTQPPAPAAPVEAATPDGAAPTPLGDDRRAEGTADPQNDHQGDRQNAPAPAGADPALVAGVVGGLGALAAGGVVAALARRRLATARARGLGRRTAEVSDELRRFETALGLRSSGVVLTRGSAPRRALDESPRAIDQPSRAMNQPSPAADESAETAERTHPVAGPTRGVLGQPSEPAASPGRQASADTLDPDAVATAVAAALGEAASRGRNRRATQPAGATRPTGRAAPDASLDRTALIARVMRILAADWWARRRPAPTLELAVVDDAGITFSFADPPDAAPAGLTHDAGRIRASWDALATLPDARHPVAYPALVTLGADDDGRLVMVDLCAAGVLGVRGASAEAISAMLVELTGSPWSDELSVRAVTPDDRFVRAAAVEEVRCLPDVASGLREVERQAAQRRGLLELCGDAYDALRLDPDRADAWAPWVAVFERPVTAEQLARLEQAAEAERLGLAVVVGVTDDQAIGAGAWSVSDDERPVGVLEPEGLTLAAQTIPRHALEAVADLYERADAVDERPAPWWKEQPDAAPTSPPATTNPDDVKVVTLRPARAATGPRLRLFGPVRLEGARGEAPSRAAGRCLEYCAWLLTHPGSTSLDMSRGLFIADGTRRSNLSRLRTWLGASPAGEPYLPEAHSGRIALHPAVSSDWAELQALVARGVNHAGVERLRAALDLVEGAPLADAAPGQWAWAEGLRTEMAALVRDAGVVLARAAPLRQDAALARWACERALAAAPDDELLLAELMRAASALGDADGVRSAGRRLASLADDGHELRPETVALSQELLEGRRRTRRA